MPINFSHYKHSNEYKKKQIAIHWGCSVLYIYNSVVLIDALIKKNCTVLKKQVMHGLP